MIRLKRHSPVLDQRHGALAIVIASGETRIDAISGASVAAAAWSS
jgi:hypothetical protein